MTQAADPRLVPLRDSLTGLAIRGTGNVTYHIAECIGEGGQGWVFRANWDDPSGHVVIVKVLRPDVVATEALRRFQREAEVLRMLSTQGRPNPYVVRFYDHAVAEVPSPHGKAPLALPFTVLEYVPGPTLEKVLLAQRGKGLPAERVRRLVRQITQALASVHAQKVVHRDLKPSNILLATEAGTEIAKVTDFGLVKLVDVNLQKTAALAGASLGYAPPEQYEQGNKRVSERTDVFSLAAVVYEMLAGRPAFPFNEGENPLLILTRILNGARPTLGKVHASLSEELASQPALVESLDRELVRALQADPGARHESVTDFWTAIEAPLRAAGAPPAPVIIAPSASTKEGGRHLASGFETTARASREATEPVPLRGGPAPPAGERPAPEAQASDPTLWGWTLLTTPLGPGAIRAAAFQTGGDAVVALGRSGFLRWQRGAWIPLGLPRNVPGTVLRGVVPMPDGGLLFFGAGGIVGRLAPDGQAVLWPTPDPTITFHGAHADDGAVTLVGERPYTGTARRPVPGSTAGVVAQFAGDRLTVLGEVVATVRLRGVTRLASGSVVACGDWGALVRVELGVAEHVGPICGGHLIAIAALPDGGAVTVGAGGHALSLSPQLDAHLEAVQTTKDVLSLSITTDGQAWAGSAQARLLRRSRSGWVRMSGDLGVTSSMIAVAASARSIRAVGDDGAVVEGRLA